MYQYNIICIYIYIISLCVYIYILGAQMYQSTFSMAASSSFGMGAKELGFLQVKLLV